MERSEYEVLPAIEPRHWWHGGMRALVAAFLDPLYRDRHDLRILDAGCGTGGNMHFLRRYGQVWGLDYADIALELAAHTLAGRLARGSVMALPYADASFDLVTSFDVLYHRGVPDEAPALHEMRRVLAPGGRVLLRLPAYEFLRSKHDRAVHTRRRYTVREVLQLVAAAGFVPERWSYGNTLLFPLAVAQRLSEKALPALERDESDLALPSPPVNRALRVPFALEAGWLAAGGRMPYGLSILCLAHSNKYEVVSV